MSQIRIGTSGWHYASWAGRFYPRGVRKKNLLNYYATQFDTTELNAPFYRTPTLEAVECWRRETPEDFLFAWKASKFITHWKRLTEKSENSIELLETRLKKLKPKVGPVLFQLPPHFRANRERLAGFFKLLPRRHRYTFEFRHASWYEPPILDVLREHDAALCLSDHVDAPAPWEVTASFVYVRGHGPSGRYRGSYSDATLKTWARRFRSWRSHRRDVFCYFDNDHKSMAPRDAARLLELLQPGVAARRARAA